MKKKLITLCLCLCLAVTMLSGTALAAGTKFSDVGANSYYATPVNWAVSEGITAGTGNGSTFSPDDTCTHAQILTFLWRAAGSPEKDFLYNPFDNISENAYYFKAAVWAYEKGMMTLTDDSGFEPNKACTRAATVEYLWRYAGRPAAQLVSFTDVSVNSSMIHSISWAVDHGVTAGTGNGSTFSPNMTCTRGQIVTFLYRYFVEPLDTSAAPAPAPAPAPVKPDDTQKLDPLPPAELTKQPDWYMSLTPAYTMSNARLAAEYENITDFINRTGMRTDGTQIRQSDLWSVLFTRANAVRMYREALGYPWGAKDYEEDYQAVLEYGDIAPLEPYI